MNRKILFFLGIGMIILAYVLNVRNTIDNYGITKSNLTTQVFAAAATAPGGSLLDRYVDQLKENLDRLVEMGGAIAEWWESKVHTCEESTCSVNIIFLQKDGHYMQCVPGSSYAHCWECATSCDVLHF